MKDAWIVYSDVIIERKMLNGEADIAVNLAKEKYGLDIELVSAHDFYIACDDGGNRLYYKGEEIKSIPKYIIFRKYDIYLARQLELMGAHVMNSSQAMVDARNKMKSYQMLTKAGVKIPKTLYIVCGLKRKTFTYSDVKEYFNSDKFILKYATGSRGVNVYLITNEEEFNEIIPRYNEIPIFQEYVETSFGKDIRCYVINGKFVACAVRQSDGDNFRSNLAQGGEAKKFEADERVKDLAIRSAKALNLDICGVDILFDKDDYTVCEVNSLPGFKSINSTTDMRANDLLIDLIYERKMELESKSKK